MFESFDRIDRYSRGVEGFVGALSYDECGVTFFTVFFFKLLSLTRRSLNKPPEEHMLLWWLQSIQHLDTFISLSFFIILFIYFILPPPDLLFSSLLCEWVLPPSTSTILYRPDLVFHTLKYIYSWVYVAQLIRTRNKNLNLKKKKIHGIRTLGVW